MSGVCTPDIHLTPTYTSQGGRRARAAGAVGEAGGQRRLARGQTCGCVRVCHAGCVRRGEAGGWIGRYSPMKLALPTSSNLSLWHVNTMT